MELTEDNFNVYAAHYYTNHRCLSENEFIQDLRQISTIRRMMSKFIESKEINIRLLINNVVIFYNCFEHHAATKMLQHKVDPDHIGNFNAILKFLNLPMLIPPQEINDNFYKLIQDEFQ